MATIYIENKPYEVKDGQNLLQACLNLGFNLPYFCWHPAMQSVGACRQCAVKQFRDEADTRGPDRDGLHDAGQQQHPALDRRPGGSSLPRGQHRVADAEPPPRLPGLRRGRRVPPPGHDRYDRSRLPPDPLSEAVVPEPVPRAVRPPRAQSLHPVLPMRQVLPELRGGRRPGRVRHPRPTLLRPRAGRRPRERVLGQPRRGLPDGRVHGPDALPALQQEMGLLGRSLGLRPLLRRLQHAPGRALRDAPPGPQPLQRGGQRLLPVRPRPLRLRVRQLREASPRAAHGDGRVPDAGHPGRRDRQGGRDPPERSGDRNRLAPGVTRGQLRPPVAGRRGLVLRRDVGAGATARRP